MHFRGRHCADVCVTLLAQAILEERLSDVNNGNASSEPSRSKNSIKQPVVVPDALYMVGNVPSTSSHVTSCETCRHPTSTDDWVLTKRSSYINGKLPG